MKGSLALAAMVGIGWVIHLIEQSRKAKLERIKAADLRRFDAEILARSRREPTTNAPTRFDRTLSEPPKK